MKQLSCIAAAALLATAWIIAGPLSQNSSSDSINNRVPSALSRPAPPQPILTKPGTERDGMVEVPAQDKGGATLSFSSTSYQQCRQYIANNFQRFGTVRQIARERHWNAGFVARLFQQYGHQSPEQYWFRLKTHQAAEALRQGKEQVM